MTIGRNACGLVTVQHGNHLESLAQKPAIKVNRDMAC